MGRRRDDDDDNYEYVELEDVRIQHTTDKACLIDLGGEKIWIPWSQIEDNGEEFVKGYEGPMFVTEWFARKEGLD